MRSGTAPKQTCGTATSVPDFALAWSPSMSPSRHSLYSPPRPGLTLVGLLVLVNGPVPSVSSSMNSTTFANVGNRAEGQVVGLNGY